MGLAHTRRLAMHPQAHLCGFYDLQVGAAQELRDRFAESALVYETFDEACSAKADAIIIATPTGCHHQQISAAVRAGRHTLAEKPLASTRAEIESLVDLADGHPHLHCVLGYQRRFWHNYRFLREQLTSEKWGQVRSVTFVNTERWEAEIAGTWRDDPDTNFGGFAGDAGSHKIDALMYVTGLQPQELFAVTHNSRSHVPVVASVTGHLSGDIPFTMVFTGNAHNYHEELLIHCDEADVILRNGDVFVAQQNHLQQIPIPANESGPQSTLNPVSGLIQLLSEPMTNPAPFSAALPVFDITNAILESAWQGQPVTL